MNEHPRREFLGRSASCLLGGSLLGSCLRAADPGTGLESELSAQLLRDIPKLLRSYDVPGLSIALVGEAGKVWNAGFGLRDVETKAPVTPETIFEAASFSKPVFAHAVLQLCGHGELDLDAPLTRYLPTPFIADEPRLERITARMVLSHTSAIPHASKPGKPLTLQADPGTKFSYSAGGFHYLQLVVSKITGKPLEEFMRASVLDPVEMKASSFEWRAEYENLRATGYDRKGQPGKTFNERYRLGSAEWRAEVGRLHPDLLYPSAAGGLYSTAADFVRFLLHQDRGLSPELAAEMQKPQVKINRHYSWGLGWGLLHAGKGDALWHWGNWGIFHHFAALEKQSGRGVVIMTNSGNGLKLCLKLVPKAIGLKIDPLADLMGA